MQVLIALLPLVVACLAGNPSYSPAEAQHGLLVLPKQDTVTTTTTTTKPQTNQVSNENLEYVNSRAKENLKQEEGSEQGVYHVYLQDGRLQRVQYVTAPVRSGQQAQQQKVTSNNYNQGQQTPEILTPGYADKRGAYFVQVPQERIQELQANYQEATQKNGQYTQAFTSAQYRQQASKPLNVKYLPYEEAASQSQFAPAAFSSQFRREQAVDQTVFGNVGKNSYQNSRQIQQVEQPSGSSYLANIQYSQVEPIQGPVYSYQPQSLTRILRYAPVY